jgi:hypothetical protein
MVTDRSLKIWRALAIISLILIALVVARGVTSNPGVSPGGGRGGEIGYSKFRCSLKDRDIEGTCSNWWFGRLWNNNEYCSDVEEWCKAAGGTYKEIP